MLILSFECQSYHLEQDLNWEEGNSRSEQNIKTEQPPKKSFLVM